MIFNKIKNSIIQYFVRKIALLSFIFLFSGVVIFAANNVIILNGVSSAGKSSIQKELRTILGRQWVSFSMDDYVTQEFIRLYPAALGYPEFIDETLIDTYLNTFHSTQIADFLHSNDPFYKMIQDAKNSLQHGKDVILDLVLYDEKYDYLLQGLNLYNIKLVMIYCCPIKILEHIESRNKIAGIKGTSLKNKLSHRTVARAIRRFASLYQPTTTENSLGKITQDDLAFVLEQARQDFDTADMGKTGTSGFMAFAQTITEKLDLLAKPFVYVAPIRQHDLIIDNSSDTPEQGAQKIVAQLHLLPEESPQQPILGSPVSP